MTERTEVTPAVPSSSDRVQIGEMLDSEGDVEIVETVYNRDLGVRNRDLGAAMARDARRVSRGELSSEAFWKVYDDDAAQTFGEDYRETPNTAIDRESGTIEDGMAASLQCAAESIEDVDSPEPSSEADEDASETTWGMVIDLQKCVGCDSCTVACKAENRTPPGVSYNVVLERETGTYPNVSRTNVPRPCMQCERPPCVQVCPVNATYKMDNGIVTIDYERCIGCRYCMIACPYDARDFDFGHGYDRECLEAGEVTSPEYGLENPSRESGESPIGNVRKCNFCYHRLQRGEEPACVETCVGDARYAGNLDDPGSEVAKMATSSRAFQLEEKEGTDPNVYYLK